VAFLTQPYRNYLLVYRRNCNSCFPKTPVDLILVA
jgi:hypothetical protein